MSRIEAAAPRVAMDMQMAKMAEKAKQQERPMKSKEVPLPPPAKENVKVSLNYFRS